MSISVTVSRKLYQGIAKTSHQILVASAVKSNVSNVTVGHLM
jgi:hypothetical protein